MSRSNESTPNGRRPPGDLGRRATPSGRRNTGPSNDDPYRSSRWQFSTRHERDDDSSGQFDDE